MKALAVCCCVLLLASTAQAGFFGDLIDNIKGMFAHHDETPYNVSRALPGYEERLYPAKNWVCTTQEGQHVGDNMGPLFWKLFSYITGANANNMTIPMTVPVTTEVTIRSAEDKSYTMCFYLDEAYQGTAPGPNNPSVFLSPRPAMRVLTRTVGGYVDGEAKWMSEAGLLSAVIQENGESVSLSHMYWVGYDAPMKFWNRRNEVWFPVA